MTINNFFWANDITPRKSTIIHEVDRITMVNTKLDTLTEKLERMDIKIVDVTI